MADFDSGSRSFGWIPNRPNPAALRFSTHPASYVVALPPARILSVPPSLDQGALGSCTAHGVAMAVAILARARGLMVWLSRLMIYFGARKRLGTIGEDSGAMPDDALATVKAGEAGPESLCPYDVARFRETPPAAALAVARAHDLDFHDLDLEGDVVLAAKVAIASGFPVNLGFRLRAHPSGGMEIDHLSAAGVLNWNPGHTLTRAGHDVLVVGYDDAIQAFWVVNSWGTNWGVELPGQPERGRGCFAMPYTMFASGDVSDRSAVTDWK